MIKATQSTHNQPLTMFKTYLLALAILVPTLLSAQSQTFGGIITDEKTSRTIDDIEVQITHSETKVSYQAITDDDGKFEFHELPVGKYSLEVIDEDFNTKKFNFEVTETHIPDLDFAIGRKVSWMWNWGDRGEQEHYWSHFVSKGLMILYFACLLLVLFYSILQLSLAIAYVKNKRKKKVTPDAKPVFDPEKAPKVTV